MPNDIERYDEANASNRLTNPTSCLGAAGAAPSAEALDSLLTNPRHVRSDLQLIARAVRSGWDVSPSVAAVLRDRVFALANDPDVPERTRERALKTLAIMEGAKDLDGRGVAGAELAAMKKGGQKQETDEDCTVGYDRVTSGSPVTSGAHSERPTMGNIPHTEKLLDVKSAIDLLEKRVGKRYHVDTFRLWATRGVRGVKLDHVRVGREIHTSAEALHRFFSAIAQAHRGEPAESEAVSV